MKVILFENGEIGRRVNLPGENPVAEIEELLGGPAEEEMIAPGALLYTREDGVELELPIRYSLHRRPSTAEPICGDAVLVLVNSQGRIRDAKAVDLEAADCYVWPVMGKRT